ncbi:hypothetical protein FA95DRAFT_1544950 [Auriscalpium vulgare]|uniref:Uncharacterized protein n=1 Tax=Auriscalpium vulgare TaxID=40419 RepID=A0ACB8RJU6_9AGAM|nr:hypothetical protein FA95DRAFT_1544950 [Auriscalpium vulgare]
MLSSMLAVPRPVSDSGSISDSGSLSGHDSAVHSPRFPHTRAQLSAIARQYKPADSYDSDAEGDDYSRVTSSFVAKVVALLDREHEDELKELLKAHYAGIDEDMLEQHVLELMHKHRDDVAGVPFLFLTPTRRPISRPSSRASSHSARLIPNRPDTPNSAPSSPLAYVFRRPHTPLASPLATGQGSSSYITAHESPSGSPTLPYTTPRSYTHFASSMPSSPISSPRLLSAKASEFRPHPRPLSAAASNPSTLTSLRAETPSPDLWAHSSSKATSNLAIAAPLIPDTTLLSRSGTPTSLRASIRPGEEDEDEDPFDPFAAQAIPRSFHSNGLSEYEAQWANSPISTSSLSDGFQPSTSSDKASFGSQPSQDSSLGADPDTADMLTDGMTPFDVLASVFGASLAPSELEEALAANGYDFERSMAWLVDRAAPPQHLAQAARTQNMGSRVSVVSRDGAGGFVRGGRAGYQQANMGGRNPPKFVNGRQTPGGNRVCRYFLAGECLRADCRFSHDPERALCRFWLRGTCAKGEACDFLHHLPNDVDISTLTSNMNRTDLNGNGDTALSSSPPPDDFPSLDAVSGDFKGRRGAYYGRNDRTYFDPGRTRFAAAVKKPAPSATAPVFQPRDPASLAARREAMGIAADSLHHRTAIVAPKASPRLKLRPPTLLPTLPTGESVNKIYMGYRSRALQLGAARNACLSRAADAWRRGDGAAAKRFSREGHDLNAKMATEMAESAATLVRERARLSEQAVKARDPSWSDDPGDRSARGRMCGGGLGVTLGIARIDAVGEGGKLSPEERTEVALDLHGLHSNEATEVLEEFLLSLEREHFYGLAYMVVGEEKHTGTQDVARGASRERLAAGVREWLHRWGYPWSERDGVICVDVLTHL